MRAKRSPGNGITAKAAALIRLASPGTFPRGKATERLPLAAFAFLLIAIGFSKPLAY